MSVCVIYMLLSGGIFMSPGCAVEQGLVYPDEIIYTSELPRQYSHAPIYQSTYRPRIIYSPTWRTGYRNHWRNYPRANWAPRHHYIVNKRRAVIRKKRRAIESHHHTKKKHKKHKKYKKKGKFGAKAKGH